MRSMVEGALLLANPLRHTPSTTPCARGPPPRAGEDRRSADLLAGLRPVGQEAFNALVGQRMLDQLADHRRRRGHHVGADARGLDDGQRALLREAVAYGSGLADSMLALQGL